MGIVTNRWGEFTPPRSSEGGYGRSVCCLSGRHPQPTWHPVHCTLEASQRECCTDHVLIPPLQVNVQRDQLDTRFPPFGDCRPTPRCFMSETWSQSTIVFALFNSSSRQQIFLTPNSTMVSSSILTGSTFAPPRLSPAPALARHCLSCRLTPSTVSLHPTLLRHTVRTGRFALLAGRIQTSNLQVGDLSYKYCKAQATLKLSHCGKGEA